jgi:glycosyltransferase involved in cell wall biosynthesis
VSDGFLVSVIIAVKNGERYLAEAIESIRAQTYKQREIVVIDGASTDRSFEIASSYDQVRCLRQRGDGLAGAWNEGIEASSGELIAFLDSDDRWLPAKLEAQVRLLAARPELAGAIGRVRFFLEPGMSRPSTFKRELLESDHVANMPGALLVRRSVFERIGHFCPANSITTDIDWFARLELGLVDEVVIEKRVHDSHLYLCDEKGYQRGLLRALRDSVRRQQTQG